MIKDRLFVEKEAPKGLEWDRVPGVRAEAESEPALSKPSDWNEKGVVGHFHSFIHIPTSITTPEAFLGPGEEVIDLVSWSPGFVVFRKAVTRSPAVVVSSMNREKRGSCVYRDRYAAHGK